MVSVPQNEVEAGSAVELPHREKVRLWTEAAIPVLEEVASRFGGYITYQELADLLFSRTGATTTQQIQYWIRGPLEGAIRHCLDQGLPALTALVVHKNDGMVGSGFNEWLKQTGRSPVEDPMKLEQVAAEERLKCYRLYASDVPADAQPTLTRELAERVGRRKAAEPRLTPLCSTCQMTLALSGECGFCD